MNHIETYRYPKDKPGGAVIGAKVDVTAFKGPNEVRAAVTEALARIGVPFLATTLPASFPFNLQPKGRIEVETDSVRPALMVIRYYGPVNNPAPQAKPYVDEDDDEL